MCIVYSYSFPQNLCRKSVQIRWFLPYIWWNIDWANTIWETSKVKYLAEFDSYFSYGIFNVRCWISLKTSNWNGFSAQTFWETRKATVVFPVSNAHFGNCARINSVEKSATLLRKAALRVAFDKTRSTSFGVKCATWNFVPSLFSEHQRLEID